MANRIASLTLAGLRRRGFEFRTDGRQLFVKPFSELKPDDVQTIKQLKPELIEELTAEQWVQRELDTWDRRSDINDETLRIIFDCDFTPDGRQLFWGHDQ